ncbi:Type II secretion system protein D precursor [Poriferisphaera corsica]|uniref:Type II secretion system protein D n=1 Tax=Poriferisphaera corsica TaxID=2528020 RepID=A0A517YY99_9BACT|nr:secretin N-terminal domain-containing protein [Poriferisphaera corsica]QDU35200.1 Type II secretion system protein D precursor [Poriferisphaera corsica]
MGKLTTSFWLGIFLCSVGTVYTGSGNKANAQNEVEAVDYEMVEPEVIDLYDEELIDDDAVKVGSFGEVDIHTKRLDISRVLQQLSTQSQRNIIVSRNVSGEISADLYGVDFYEALDAILDSNGFGYREKGNFIYVYTKDELRQLEEMNRQLVTKIIRLNYLNSIDAAQFITPVLTPGVGSVTGVGQVAAGFEATLSDGGSDTYANSGTIVVRDYEDNMEDVLALIEQLDIRPAQVLIESWILQAQLDENNEFGVDFAIFTDVNISDFTNPLNAINEIIAGDTANPVNSGQVITSQVGQTNRVGGAKLGFFGSDFSVFVRALDQVTDTTVLAKPQLLVLNRQRAELLVGEKLGYLSTTQTETSTTQTVEFLEIGTSLNVRPFISNDGFVRMELMPKISEGSTTSEDGTIIPNETTNQMTTNVMVKSGQTVVLGGFFKESNQIDRRQIPGLGDIPIAGAAFKGQDDTIQRDEVIFMIRPTVIKDKQLAAMGDSALDGAQKAIMGSRDGLLPFGQAKMTNAYLRDAREQLARGESDKAMWAVDAALYIDPSSVEAMRMKEELTGQEFYYKSDSILDNAVDAMINAEVEKQQEEISQNIEEANNAAKSSRKSQPVNGDVVAAYEKVMADEVAAVAENTSVDAIFEALRAEDNTENITEPMVDATVVNDEMSVMDTSISEEASVDEIFDSLRVEDSAEASVVTSDVVEQTVSVETNDAEAIAPISIFEEYSEPGDVAEVEASEITQTVTQADEMSIFDGYDEYLADETNSNVEEQLVEVFDYTLEDASEGEAIQVVDTVDGAVESVLLTEVETGLSESPLK